LRVAHILLSPRIGGAEQIVAGLNEHFNEVGIESKVFYLDPSAKKQGRLRRLFSLRRQLIEFDAEHVLAHSFLPSIYSRLARPRSSSVHYVLHSASDDYRRVGLQLIERLLHVRTKSVIAVDAKQLDVYKSHFKHTPKSVVINNGISAVFFPNEDERIRPKTVVTIARVANQKRPDFWVEVARLAETEGFELVFEWWGPLSGDSSVDKFVLLNLPANAHYMGPTLNPERVLAKSDISFVTSNREAGSSLSLLEAAAAGKPQLCSDQLTLASELTKSVVRYESINPDSALNGLKFICENWAESSANAKSNAELVSQTFGVKRTAELYADWLRHSS